MLQLFTLSFSPVQLLNSISKNYVVPKAQAFLKNDHLKLFEAIESKSSATISFRSGFQIQSEFLCLSLSFLLSDLQHPDPSKCV